MEKILGELEALKYGVIAFIRANANRFLTISSQGPADRSHSPSARTNARAVAARSLGLPRTRLSRASRHGSTDRSDTRLAQLVAGKVFLVRVASAMLALVSQVLLARWMGTFEFGIYIYVWTWVLMIGALSDIGLSSAARRFIPEYTELKAYDRLRGFLAGSRWLAFAIATAIRRVGALGVWLLRALARSLRRRAALSRLPHDSDLRAGAGPSRHRAVLRLVEPGADAVLHLAAARSSRS